MRKRNPISIILYLGILALILWAIFSLFSTAGNDVPYSEVVSLMEQGKVKSFVVADGHIFLKLHEPYQGKTDITTGLADPELFRQEMFSRHTLLPSHSNPASKTYSSVFLTNLQLP